MSEIKDKNPKKPTISLCMIAKDEEDFIKKTIEAAKPLVDEIIVVDTGSKDRTKEIAQKLGAKVFDFKWNNDFSEAHNLAVEKAEMDWVLVLDADETISRKDHKKILKLVKDESVDGYVLEQRTYSTNVESHNWSFCEGNYEEEKDFAGYFASKLVRLFRNNKGYKFIHKNHDVVDPSIKEKNGKIVNPNIPMHHFAKTKGTSFFEGKVDQYLEMGLNQIKEEPSNPRPYYEIGLIYLTKNDLKKAEKNFKKVVELNPGYKTAFAQLGIIELKRKNYKKAAEIFQDSIQRKPKQDLAYLYLGELMMMINKFEKAARIFKQAALINPKNFKAHQKYCTAMVHNKKPDLALKVMLKIHNKNKSIAEVYNSLGEIYFAKENYEMARQVLQKGVALAEKQNNTPKKILMMINLAEAYRHLGKKDEALSLLNETLTLNPKNVDAIRQRIQQIQNS